MSPSVLFPSFVFERYNNSESGNDGWVQGGRKRRMGTWQHEGSSDAALTWKLLLENRGHKSYANHMQITSRSSWTHLSSYLLSCGPCSWRINKPRWEPGGAGGGFAWHRVGKAVLEVKHQPIILIKQPGEPKKSHYWEYICWEQCTWKTSKWMGLHCYPEVASSLRRERHVPRNL